MTECFHSFKQLRQSVQMALWKVNHKTGLIIIRVHVKVRQIFESEHSDSSGGKCLLDMTDQQPWMFTGPWGSLLVIGIADQWEVLSLDSRCRCTCMYVVVLDAFGGGEVDKQI